MVRKATEICKVREERWGAWGIGWWRVEKNLRK